MAATTTIQNTVDSLRSYADLFPISGSSGWESEPALSIANEVMQFILSPPFAWRWNRVITTFALTTGTQDYTQALSSFGWLEKASIAFAGTPTREIEISLNLPPSNAQVQPIKISPYLDDDAGNITFRFMGVPDQNYTASIVYQKSAPAITALSQTWAPLPDYLEYLYISGFRAMLLRHRNDARYFAEMAEFQKLLVMQNAGLSESQMNIFLSDRIDSARQQAASLGVPPSRAHASRLQGGPPQ